MTFILSMKYKYFWPQDGAQMTMELMGPQNGSKSKSKTIKFRVRFLTSFGTHFGFTLEVILGFQNNLFFIYFQGRFLISVYNFFGRVLGPFWGPFWDQIGPRSSQDGPKRAIKSFKDPKTSSYEKL